ncbi:MAG: hypothetical protein LBK65_06285 [Tannerellaceae bacterium]|jgi:hypothetical protein|nr:hypothetical protein [Tannerellaceae bacterium]
MNSGGKVRIADAEKGRREYSNLRLLQCTADSQRPAGADEENTLRRVSARVAFVSLRKIMTRERLYGN